MESLNRELEREVGAPKRDLSKLLVVREKLVQLEVENQDLRADLASVAREKRGYVLKSQRFSIYDSLFWDFQICLISNCLLFLMCRLFHRI